jgi:surface protein
MHNLVIAEERYQLVEWLYRIRKQYKRMGLFQPDFICIIFGKMMVSKLVRTDVDIRKAVDDWLFGNRTKAMEEYGPMNKWNTSLVTNMKRLFYEDADISKWDISGWDVSNVTDMSNMFYYNKSFNGDISGWDVSNVTNMSNMFMFTSFDRDISGWNVSSVTNMRCMFNQTCSFNGDISGWNVSSVTDMEGMLKGTIFNGDISRWNVSNVTNMKEMFALNRVFNGDISQWDVSNVIDMSSMFMFTSFDRDISGWDVSKLWCSSSSSIGNYNLRTVFQYCPIQEVHKFTWLGSDLDIKNK